MKIKAKVRAVNKRIAESKQPRPTPQMPPFRPMTGRPGTVVLPPIPILRQKRQHRRRHKHIEEHVSIKCQFSTRELDYLRAVALRVGVTVQTIIRISVRRFLAMPDLRVPVGGKIPGWMLGIQRHAGSIPRQHPRVPLVPRWDRPARPTEASLGAIDEQLLEMWADFPGRRRSRRPTVQDLPVSSRTLEKEIAAEQDTPPEPPTPPAAPPSPSPSPTKLRLVPGRRLIVRKPTP